MNKSLFYKIVILVLLALNAFLMYKLFTKESERPHRPRMEAPKHRIIKKLNFDEVQIQQFEELIKKHHKEVSEKDREIMTIKKEILSSLNQDSMSDLSSQYKRIGEIQAQIEEIHFKHFIDIKSICKENQLSTYYDMTKHLIQHFGKRRHHSKQQHKRDHE